MIIVKLRKAIYYFFKRISQFFLSFHSGNYLTKDLTDVIQKEHVVESEFLLTYFVAVPKYYVKDFLSCYEKLAEFVVPRSALLIVEDSDYAIYRVVLFKKNAEQFKSAAREKK